MTGYDRAVPAVGYVAAAGPCSLCGRPSFATVAGEAAHLCCWSWRALMARSGDCPACLASERRRAVRA